MAVRFPGTRAGSSQSGCLLTLSRAGSPRVRVGRGGWPIDSAALADGSGQSGKGARTREEIELVFDRNKSAIYSLYSRALRDNPALQGKVVLEVTIAPSGDVLISGRYSRESIAAVATGLFEAFPEGLHFEILNMTAEGDRVAVEATSRGMHASGKLYANHYHFLFHLRDGRIAVMKKFMDTEHATDVLCGGQRP